MWMGDLVYVKPKNRKSSMLKKHNISAVFVTGPAGNGKTVMIDLLYKVMRIGPMCHRVRRMDMSKIITLWGMNQETPLGRKLRKQEKWIAQGNYLSDNLAIETFTEWLGAVTGHANSPEVFVLAGVPRTISQLVLCNLFERHVVVYIDATRNESDTAILRRAEQNIEIRLGDETKLDLRERRWHEHITKTAPIRGYINGNGLYMERAKSLPEKLSFVLQGLCERDTVDKEFTTLGISRLRALTHPIHKDIAEIEDPKENLAAA